MAENSTKKCPFCGERIQIDAIKCRFCKEFLEDENGLPVSYHDSSVRTTTPLRRVAEEEPQEAVETAAEFYAVTPSLWALTGLYLKAACGAVVAGLLMFYPIGNLLKEYAKASEAVAGQVDFWTDWAGLALLGIIALVLMYRAVSLKRIHYEIGPDRIEFTRGIFSRKIDNLDVFRIADLKLHRSLLDCVTGVGSVTLMTRDETDPTFQFEKVKDPKVLYDIIKKASLVADRRQGVVHLE